MANKVLISNQQNTVKIPSGLRILIRRSCNAVLEFEKFPYPAEISVTFVDNAAIAALNEQYRHKPHIAVISHCDQRCPGLICISRLPAGTILVVIISALPQHLMVLLECTRLSYKIRRSDRIIQCLRDRPKLLELINR